MAVSNIESVLKFSRKNGFSDSESALKEDLLEKSKLRSFDFEKFLFPMVPSPHPLKIPAIQSRPEVEASGGGDLSNESSEEFVSLCSSDFTNPYGIQTMTRVGSQASSDRLSQFGTAHDYQDFDMQNDLYWYNEGDEDYTVPPHFGRLDSFVYPSEDKFVMTSDTRKQIDSPLGSNHISEGLQTVERSNYLDRPWPFTTSSTDNENGVQFTYYYHLDENIQYERSAVNEKKGCTVCGCSASICRCGSEAGGFFNGYQSLMNLRVTDENDVKYKKSSTSGWAEEYNLTNDLHNPVAEKDFLRNGKKDYEGGSAKEESTDPHEPEGATDEDEGITAYQLLMYDINENEYEVFNLRIIHRKKRPNYPI